MARRTRKATLTAAERKALEWWFANHPSGHGGAGPGSHGGYGPGHLFDYLKQPGAEFYPAIIVARGRQTRTIPQTQPTTRKRGGKKRSR